MRGRDIHRYQTNWANLYLIATHNGYDGLPAVDINDYPAVKHHLDNFYYRLARRHDKGRTPYNLRNCAYYSDFGREKLLWMDMAAVGRFAYSTEHIFSNDKGFIMTGESLQYLCAVLNSTPILWWMEKTALTTGMGRLQWKKFIVKSLPIPKVSRAQQEPYMRIVEKIIAMKAADSSADTSDLEADVNRMVYDLYGLTSTEIRAVEALLPGT